MRESGDTTTYDLVPEMARKYFAKDSDEALIMGCQDLDGAFARMEKELEAAGFEFDASLEPAEVLYAMTDDDCRQLAGDKNRPHFCDGIRGCIHTAVEDEILSLAKCEGNSASRVEDLDDETLERLLFLTYGRSLPLVDNYSTHTLTLAFVRESAPSPGPYVQGRASYGSATMFYLLPVETLPCVEFSHPALEFILVLSFDSTSSFF